MLTTYGHIKSGKLILSNKGRFTNDLSKIKDCVVEIVIRKKARRSNPQNAYLWGVVYAELKYAFNNLGNNFSIDDVHEFCKQEFNKVAIAGKDGEVIGSKPGSTTLMNKEEFGLYLDKIFLFANEYLGITIPLPNEKLEFEF